MKRINLISILGTTIFALVAPRAEAQTWAYEYDGNALPTASTPAWTEFFDEGVESVSGGIFTLFVGPGSNNLYRLTGGTGLEWDPTAVGSTLGVRLKVDSQTGATGAGDLGIFTGSQGWLFSFATNQIAEVIGGGSVAVNTTDDFHFYRFVISGTGGPLALYVDDGGTPVATFAGGAAVANRLDFGDQLGADDGQIQWDYIRWTNAGAFIPEPSAACLMGIGLLTVLRARRGSRG